MTMFDRIVETVVAAAIVVLVACAGFAFVGCSGEPEPAETRVSHLMTADSFEVNGRVFRRVPSMAHVRADVEAQRSDVTDGEAARMLPGKAPGPGGDA